MKIEVPADHQPLVATPGGPKCATCRFVSAADHSCGSPDYRAAAIVMDDGWTKESGDGSLPKHRSLEDLCSDWWERRVEKRDASEEVKHTANLIRTHRQVGIAKKPRKRLPRQIYPKLLEADYARRMIQIVDRARAAIVPLRHELPTLLASARISRDDGARLDANEGRRAQQLIDQARELMRQTLGGGEVENLAREFADKVQSHQRRELQKQTRAALGVDVLARDKHLAAMTEHFVSQNVSLIQSIPREVHDDLEKVVHRYVAGGGLHGDLEDEIEKRFGVGETRARRIARDQVGKFYGEVNRARQRELGVSKFVWRTVGDDHVRDEHEALEDQEFPWDEPPSEGIPGEPIQCRCTAEPVFDEILDELEDDDEDDEED